MDLTFNPGGFVGSGICFRFNCLHHTSQRDHKAKCKACLRIHGKDTEFQEVLIKKNLKKRNKTKGGR